MTKPNTPTELPPPKPMAPSIRLVPFGFTPKDLAVRLTKKRKAQASKD